MIWFQKNELIFKISLLMFLSCSQFRYILGHRYYFVSPISKREIDLRFSAETFTSTSSLSSLSTSSSAAAPTGAAFNITINYTGPAEFQPAFTAAESQWEAILPRYLNGNFNGNPVFDLTINATMENIDGAGNVLGSAGPTRGNFDDSGSLLATQGTMRFDTSDFRLQRQLSLFSKCRPP